VSSLDGLTAKITRSAARQNVMRAPNIFGISVNLELRRVFTVARVHCTAKRDGNRARRSLVDFESGFCLLRMKMIRALNDVNMKSTAEGILLGYVGIIIITVLKEIQ
jgi:hypothetical protein